MSANIDVIEQSKENILLIPLEAVKRDAEGSFVLVSRGSRTKPVHQRVELGIADEKNIEVLAGLTKDDTIISETQTYQPTTDKGSGSNPFMPFGRKKR